MTVAFGIIGDMSNYIKAIVTEKGVIFRFIEARVIEGFAAITTNRFTVRWPAGEHERSVGCSMRGENRKHLSLGIMGEMKEAVPSYEAVEPLWH